MKAKKTFEYLLIALILMTFTSCSSSGGGIGGSGVVSKGTITGFGSVFVNGVEFETTGATITTDDTPGGTEGDLDLGMVVTVRGIVNADGLTGTADSIEFADNLEGPISSADPDNKQIIVLGQTVAWNGTTRCEGLSETLINCTTLAINNLVEISGFTVSEGTIQATRIEIKKTTFNLDDKVELKGTISGLFVTTFFIGSQEVEFSTANLDDVPNNTLENGMFVEVKGNLVSLGGILKATKIELEDKVLQVSEGLEVQIEGLVSDVIPPCTVSGCVFKVSGQSVQTGPSTEFKLGGPSNIVSGARLKVKGTITNGVLIAREVSFL